MCFSSPLRTRPLHIYMTRRSVLNGFNGYNKLVITMYDGGLRYLNAPCSVSDSCDCWRVWVSAWACPSLLGFTTNHYFLLLHYFVVSYSSKSSDAFFFPDIPSDQCCWRAADDVVDYELAVTASLQLENESSFVSWCASLNGERLLCISLKRCAKWKHGPGLDGPAHEQ
jgi:hypothetical protein